METSKTANTEQKKEYLGGKTREDVKGGKDLVKLSSNENLRGPSPLVLDAINDRLSMVHEYPPRTDRTLKKLLVQMEDHPLPDDHFITANGGTEIVQMIAQTFLREGDQCIASTPCFRPYIMFSEKTGASVHDVPLLPPDYKLNCRGILDKVNEATKVIWLCSPNNPTGTHIGKVQLRQLLEHLPGHTLVVYDEVYRHFTDAADYLTALPYVRAGYPVIAINSFSKVHGLAGMRIGYAYGHPVLIQKLIKNVRPFHINTLSLLAAEKALLDQRHARETVEMIAAEKTWIYQNLKTLNVKFWPSQSNFIMIHPHMDAFTFEQKMLERGVMVRPVENFGAPGCVRVTIGRRSDNEKYIEALRWIINYSGLWGKV